MSISSIARCIAKHPVALAAGAVATIPTTILGGMWIYGLRGFSSTEDRKQELPGDDLLLPGDSFARLQEDIVIDAPPEVVWQVIAQLGQRKGGFYALSWLERLFTFHIHNVFDRVDTWQEVKPGDFMFYHQSGIGSQIAEVEPGSHFTSLSDTRRPPTYQGSMALLPPFGLTSFAWTWNFILQELPDGRTRFVNRCDSTWEPWGTKIPSALIYIWLGSPSVFMVRKMLIKVKKVAEGRQAPQIVDRLVRAIGVWHSDAKPVALGVKRDS